MPAHIVDHSVQVCRVALLLTEKLKSAGIKLNYSLVQASSLLHDITKTRSFITGENHASTGHQLISGMGYSDVGQIIGQHVRLKHYPMIKIPGEADIVNYADKRVLHDKIVPLKARMEYILERYGIKQEHRKRIKTLWEKTEEMEAAIFKYLIFSPEDLEKILIKEKMQNIKVTSHYKEQCSLKR
jgi:uncharacterized protein